MNVFLSDEQDRPVDAVSLRNFAVRVLEEEGYAADTELAVVLVGAKQMTDYNERFMDRKGPTDVLAFPIEDLVAGSAPRRLRDEPPVALGDVFLCPEEIEARARAEGFVYDDFLHLLLAHGILHLLGYDHDDDTTADAMEKREDELLALIGRSLG
ncbi:MAG: rRNA maturation RNase YbeY [Actinobacteria bacterium RBG_16_68_21]|nr:MAG: rRNA maturation RNase YbeY [Actinobacteria bacterium RBG_16_68_21]